jgi:hypothetical protein
MFISSEGRLGWALGIEVQVTCDHCEESFNLTTTRQRTQQTEIHKGEVSSAVWEAPVAKSVSSQVFSPNA